MPLQFENAHLQHEEYSFMSPTWKMVGDVVEGKRAIDAEGELYLPRPIGREDEEYDAYRTRAVFYNATARTLDGLLGAIFRKDTTCNLPVGISYLKENTDGEGNNILQFSKRVTRGVITKGRYGLLVDFPQATGVKTLADEISADLKARVVGYSPESIINWHTDRVGGIVKLTHVLIKERVFKFGDHAFKKEEGYRYRLLQLNAGVYEVVILEPKEIKDSKGNTKNVVEEVGRIIPKLPNNKTFDFIPFVFAGSINNTPDIDRPPLADLAELNLAHYRNSADYEEAVFMVGQPTPWINGLDEDFIEKNRGQIKFGSRRAWLLPEGCEAGLIESKAEKNIIQKALEMKENEMIGLGARLVQDNTSRGSESTESVLLRRSGEASSLACIAENVSIAVELCIKWAAMWMNIKESGIIFKLNKDFFPSRLTHQEISALVGAWQARAIPHRVLLDNYRRGEIIPETMTDEEVIDLIETEEPFEGYELSDYSRSGDIPPSSDREIQEASKQGDE